MRIGVATVGLWSALAIAPADAGVAPPVRVVGVRFGLGGQYKIGSWAPVLIQLDARPNGFTGTMMLRSADSDDATAVFTRTVNLPPGPSGGVRTVMSYVKPGSGHGELGMELRDAHGAIAAQYTFDSRVGLPDGLHQDENLIVSVGPAAGLAELLSRKEYADQYTLAQVRTVEELPRRWYGYDAADWVVWTTGSERTMRQILRRMGSDQKQALAEWVRRGGRLVLSVARQWQEVNQSFLSELLPEPLAKLVPAVDVDGLPARFAGRDGLACAVLRSYHVSNPRLVTRPRHWKIRSEASSIPLAVSYPVEFGQVTLLCFDVDRAPSRRPDGAQNYWKKLLSVELRGEDETPGRLPRRVTERNIADLGSLLKANIDHFEAVKPIPFTLVALLSFVYILLIGPLDYLLLKKVIRRMELTWITFTVMVVAVSAAAYYVAVSVKGRHMRLNQIDVVDVNVADRRLRGTSWFTIFCPQNDRLDLSLDRPGTIMSWLGRPEGGFGGMYRHRSGGMLQGEYTYGPNAASLAGVPVAIWSTKSVMARWRGEWAGQFTSRLVTRAGGVAARGTVTNHWGADLEDAVVAYARRLYFIGRLRDGQTVALESLRNRDLAVWLETQGGGGGVTPGSATRLVDRFDRDAARTDPDQVLRLMMFFRRVPRRYLTQTGSPRITSAQFGDIDLSGHLDHGYAILLGRVGSGGPRLAITGWGQPKVRRHTYVRAVLPVAKGASTP